MICKMLKNNNSTFLLYHYISFVIFNWLPKAAFGISPNYNETIQDPCISFKIGE